MSCAKAYHGEIGREATAQGRLLIGVHGAYHREIGREATAPDTEPCTVMTAYHREIGREATARNLGFPARWARNPRFGLSPGIQDLAMEVVPPLAPARNASTVCITPRNSASPFSRPMKE